MKSDDIRSGSSDRGGIIGRAFRRSLVTLAVIVAIGGALIYLAQQKAEEESVMDEPVVAPVTVAVAPMQPPEVRFTDVTRSAGIGFVHESGAYGTRFLPETMGGGVAFLDYDNDGDQDLLLVNSDVWPEKRDSATVRPIMALYANDGRGRFEDVTASVGLDISTYGMGVAVGDYDADGWVDVFISAVGPNQLLRNAQGRFKDVTSSAGVAGDEDRWSTSSAFFDYDNDGDLDLFVANYVHWSKAIDLEVDFRLTGIGRAYGPPASYEGTHSYLYRNEGDSTFADVSAEAGIQVNNPATGNPMGKALAVALIDPDEDGHLDRVVGHQQVQVVVSVRVDGCHRQCLAHGIAGGGVVHLDARF